MRWCVACVTCCMHRTLHSSNMAYAILAACHSLAPLPQQPQALNKETRIPAPSVKKHVHRQHTSRACSRNKRPGSRKTHNARTWFHFEHFCPYLEVRVELEQTCGFDVEGGGSYGRSATTASTVESLIGTAFKSQFKTPPTTLLLSL